MQVGRNSPHFIQFHPNLHQFILNSTLFQPQFKPYSPQFHPYAYSYKLIKWLNLNLIQLNSIQFLKIHHNSIPFIHRPQYHCYGYFFVVLGGWVGPPKQLKFPSWTFFNCPYHVDFKTIQFGIICWNFEWDIAKILKGSHFKNQYFMFITDSTPFTLKIAQ